MLTPKRKSPKTQTQLPTAKQRFSRSRPVVYPRPQCQIKGSPYPTLRANPFPEVTDLFCRLPLSTLFYRPEASNLGDLMRLWVRPGVRIIFPSDFQGPSRAHRTPRITRCFTSRKTLSPGKPIPGFTLCVENHLIRKDNSLRNLRQRLWIQLCHHTSSAP